MSEKNATINVHDPFYKAVKGVFDNWTALQLAISHSFAGSETPEVAEWFLNATYQWIVENPDLENYELEEFLFDTMNKEFNSILDDNSEIQVSKFLLRLAEMSRAQRWAELGAELEKFMALKPSSSCASVKVKQDGDEESSDEDDDDDEDEDEEMEQDGDGHHKEEEKNKLSKEDEENFEKMEEGWTLITKTGKHLSK